MYMYMYMSLMVITLFVHVTNTYSLPEPASPPVLPYLFLHCPTKCLYSEWTPWEKLPVLYSTTKERCPSGHYFIQEKKKTVVSFLGKKADCQELKETQEVCSPTNAERLILILNLGQTGNSPSKPFKPPVLPVFRINIGYTPFGGVYVNLDTEGEARGKRSTDHEQNHEPEEYEPNIQTFSDHHSNNVNIDDNIFPIPFDLNIHDGHFRHKRESQCNDVKHVLFVLDSSGSVGEKNFEDIKNSVATLVPLFCGKIRVALINFSSKIKLEFCFNCYKDYDNDILNEENWEGRKAAAMAINNIEYMGGSTYTGETAKCICDKVLNKECGISTMPDCLRVIFITDGKSNDPKHKVCEEIKCLHDKTGVSTIAVGIEGYNINEMRCITDASDDSHIFDYKTFLEFNQSIELVIEKIINGTQTCAKHDTGTKLH